jgi:hypothetical protein
MDPLSVSASVVALVDITVKTISTCAKLISKAKNASKELGKVSSEVNDLKGILEDVKGPVQDADSPQYARVKEARREGGPFAKCESVMAEIQEELEKLDGVPSWQFKMKWLASESKVMRLLKDLDTAKKSLALALAGQTLAAVTDMKAMITGTEGSKRRSDVISWLRRRSPDTTVNFTDARMRFEESTGEWLLRSEPFQSWTEGGRSLLWLTGIQGAGKTVIT